MTIKIAEDVPRHVAQFIRACSELKLLQAAHVEHLSRTNKADSFPDSESIFIKAGIALLCSAWEAYVEDLARNGIDFLIKNCKEPKDLPEGVRKNIAKEIRLDKNELAPWELAGDDWRNVVLKRFEAAIAREVNTLNSPKAHKVKSVFSEMLGIDDITTCWHWAMFDVKSVSELVNHLVETRGSIAHGRNPTLPAHTIRMIYLEAVVTQCAFLMNNHVREHLLKITSKDPWAMVRYTQDWTKFCTEEENA
jgi:hypothetical protein